MKKQTQFILLVAGLVTVCIVVIRILTTTPLVRSILETFESSTKLTNSTTECPAGYTLYMYEGSAYCCKGRVNKDAGTVERSCIPQVGSKDSSICTLGPSSSSVKNCNVILKDILAKKNALCPPSKPNFCNGSPNGTCCASTVTADGKACVDPDKMNQCNIGSDSNIFVNPQDCRLQRMMETDKVCPEGMNRVTIPFQGLSVYGCTDGHSNCYTQKVVDALNATGFSTATTGMRVC